MNKPFPCGCEVQGDAMIIYCKKHGAAPKLYEALKVAVSVIRQWHDIDKLGQLSGHDKDYMWDVYYNQSPELQPIRQALSSAEDK